MHEWSSQRSLSQSKIVKSSGIWFVIVPVVAKLLEGVHETFTIKIGENSYLIKLALPFSWQLLFFAATFFMFATIIFHIKCSSIIKKYNTYAEFENEGNTRLQINKYLKELIWNKKTKSIDEKYKEPIEAYIEHYSMNQLTENPTNVDYLCILDDISNAQGKDSNAFYFVYNIADKHNPYWLIASSIFYYAGFICLGIIAFLNIKFVIESAI